MAMPQFTPQQRAFMISEFLRSNNINWFANVSRTNIQMYDALHVFVSEGHRTSGYSFVHETLANQVYVVATEEL
jgi:hypothetical protein